MNRRSLFVDRFFFRAARLFVIHGPSLHRGNGSAPRFQASSNGICSIRRYVAQNFGSSSPFPPQPNPTYTLSRFLHGNLPTWPVPRPVRAGDAECFEGRASGYHWDYWLWPRWPRRPPRKSASLSRSISRLPGNPPNSTPTAAVSPSPWPTTSECWPSSRPSASCNSSPTACCVARWTASPAPGYASPNPEPASKARSGTGMSCTPSPPMRASRIS